MPGGHSTGPMNEPDSTTCPASIRWPYCAMRRASQTMPVTGSSRTAAPRPVATTSAFLLHDGPDPAQIDCSGRHDAPAQHDAAIRRIVGNRVEDVARFVRWRDRPARCACPEFQWPGPHNRSRPDTSARVTSPPQRCFHHKGDLGLNPGLDEAALWHGAPSAKAMSSTEHHYPGWRCPAPPAWLRRSGRSSSR